MKGFSIKELRVQSALDQCCHRIGLQAGTGSSADAWVLLGPSTAPAERRHRSASAGLRQGCAIGVMGWRRGRRWEMAVGPYPGPIPGLGIQGSGVLSCCHLIMCVQVQPSCNGLPIPAQARTGLPIKLPPFFSNSLENL